MNIVFLTTEAVPFAKTGGLADVLGALPRSIEGLGHRAAVLMPAFRGVRQCGLEIETTDISFAVPMSEEKLVGGRLLKSHLPNSEVEVWLIDQPQYFERDGLYGSLLGDFSDNAERFAFFCRAAIQVMDRVSWGIDVIHCNDWQSALVPAIISADTSLTPRIRDAATVLTIHNMAYQGAFHREAFRFVGLPWEHFNLHEFEFYDPVEIF